MDTSFIAYLLLLLPVIQGCKYNPETYAAVCYTYQSALNYVKPEWESLTIKNQGYANLTHIGKYFFKKLPNLKILELNGVVNQLGPKSFQSNRKLEMIQLWNNHLEKIHPTLFKNLNELRNIYLVNSELNVLERGTFQDLEKLRVLCLRNNSLKIFPKNVVSSTNIEELYVEDNGLETIEQLAFINMPKLRKVNFSGNKLTTFIVPTLFGTNSLKIDRLSFGRNQLTAIHSNTFELLPNLKYLFLDQNKISTIECNALKNLHKLVILDISDNNLLDISQEIFPDDPMEALEMILLHNNRLTFLNPEILNQKPKLRYLTYFGNPLQCPCLDQLNLQLSKKNVTQICFENYENRPLCIYNTIESTLVSKCTDNVNKTKHLYDEYMTKLKDWEPWSKKCHIAEGYEHIQWTHSF